jgi:hypothetical protein
MNDVTIIPVLLAVIGSLIAWIMSGINRKLTDLTAAVSRTNDTLQAVERDLRGGLGALDRRVTAIESACRIFHGTEPERAE